MMLSGRSDIHKLKCFYVTMAEPNRAALLLLNAEQNVSIITLTRVSSVGRGRHGWRERRNGTGRRWLALTCITGLAWQKD